MVLNLELIIRVVEIQSMVWHTASFVFGSKLCVNNKKRFSVVLAWFWGYKFDNLSTLEIKHCRHFDTKQKSKSCVVKCDFINVLAPIGSTLLCVTAKYICLTVTCIMHLTYTLDKLT